MSVARLRDAARGFTELADRHPGEREFLEQGKQILAALIAHDDWLPEQYARPSPERYQQYLLHCDPLERFSIVSFVWGPGQSTPVHDHRVWGLIGVLRGLERSVTFTRADDGTLVAGEDRVGGPGDVSAVSPRLGDIHQVFNAHADQVTISIHVYGGNIGRIDRATFDPESGVEARFVSRFSNDTLPNLWRD